MKGPGRTDLRAGEIVVAVTVDALEGYGGSFQKVGQRRSLVISVACCAALVRMDSTGKWFEDVRLALGGVGPRPMRLVEAESLLRGQPASAELIERASMGHAAGVASRSRIKYRRSVVRGFVQAAIEEALSRSGAASCVSETGERMADARTGTDLRGQWPPGFPPRGSRPAPARRLAGRVAASDVLTSCAARYRRQVGNFLPGRAILALRNSLPYLMMGNLIRTEIRGCGDRTNRLSSEKPRLNEAATQHSAHEYWPCVTRLFGNCRSVCVCFPEYCISSWGYGCTD